MYIYVCICNPAHRVSRPRGTGSVGDSVGEGAKESEGAREREGKRAREIGREGGTEGERTVG